MNSTFEQLLNPEGPVALTLRQPLVSALGPQSPVFPPTFAAPEGSDEKPSYVIDRFPDGSSVALIDSVGSQANRMEPIFLRPQYRMLIPQVKVKIRDRLLDLLELGHRAADAAIRFSDAWSRFEQAFVRLRDAGDATDLARLAPTSIVFGCWDSRGTQVKLPRLVEATVRAFNVKPLTRSAQYATALDADTLAEAFPGVPDKTLSEWGVLDAPAGRIPGGVIAEGGIVREALLNLVAMRSLSGGDAEGTAKLQRYILGISLIAFLSPSEHYLRQGCLLAPAGPAEITSVDRQGKRTPWTADEKDVETFARESASAFGVGPNLTAVFEAESAKSRLEEQSQKKKSKVRDKGTR